jgi:hypothetical protein
VKKMRDMALTTGFLDAVARAEERLSSPLSFMWPMPGYRGGQLVSFSSFVDWRAFVLDLGLHRIVPEIVAAKFERGQKLLAWIDFDLFTAGELIALTALDLALKDRYGAKVKRPNGSIHFADSLRYIVEEDGLTDARVPMLQRCGGGTVVGFLTGECRPTLAERRNGLAHGDAFGMSGAGSYCAGLFELVRDLIDYAYGDFDLHLNSAPESARKIKAPHAAQK